MNDWATRLATLPGGCKILECGMSAWIRINGFLDLFGSQSAPGITSDVVAYFDESAKDYGTLWDLGASQALHIGYWDSQTWTLRQALARQNEVLAEFGNLRGQEHVFDAGCGVGGSSIFLAQKYACTAVGFTLSADQKARADANAVQAKVSDKVKFHVGDYTNSGEPEASFDVVWALESTCYAPDFNAFVRAAYTLLKPGGVLLIADAYLTRDSYTADERATLDKWLHSWAVKKLPTIRAASKSFRAAGFIDTRWADITRYVLPSARLLRAAATVAAPSSRVLHLLGKRTDWQQRNLAGAYYQYDVCRQDLARYHMVRTYKPRRPIAFDEIEPKPRAAST